MCVYSTMFVERIQLYPRKIKENSCLYFEGMLQYIYRAENAGQMNDRS